MKELIDLSKQKEDFLINDEQKALMYRMSATLGTAAGQMEVNITNGSTCYGSEIAMLVSRA
jgi:hypothetical protein